MNTDLSPQRSRLAAAIQAMQALGEESRKFAAIESKLMAPLEAARSAKAELDRAAAERKTALAEWSAGVLAGTASAAFPPMPPKGANTDAVERLLELSAQCEACESAIATLNERRTEHARKQAAVAQQIMDASLDVMVTEEVESILDELEAALKDAAKIAAKSTGLFKLLRSMAEQSEGERAVMFHRAANRIRRAPDATEHLPYDNFGVVTATAQWGRLLNRLASDPTASFYDAPAPVAVAAE